MNILDAALRYRELGWSVIPMKKEDKIPHVKWKKYQTELPTEEDLKHWFSKWPDANIALICGNLSGVFALDFDDQAALEQYKAIYDPNVQDTMCQKTAHGMHALFLTNGDTVPLIQPVAEKIDLKGEGSYIMVEPSIHPTGEPYQWIGLNPLTDGIDDILDPPSGIQKLIDDYKQSSTKRIKQIEQPKNPEGWEQELLLGVERGGRNIAAAKLAGLYLGKNYSQEDTLVLLKRWNERNVPPLQEKDIDVVVKSIFSEHQRKKSHGIAEAIEKIIVLKYPDGETKYKLCLSRDRYTIINVEDLLSSRRTIAKIVDAIRVVFNPMKQDKWLDLIRIWLNAAEEKIMDTEESELGIIRETIEEWMLQWNRQKQSEHINYDTMLKNGCVEENGIIYFLLSHLSEELRFKNVKITRTNLCEYLRRLGAKVTEPRKSFEKNRFRTWEISGKSFK